MEEQKSKYQFKITINEFTKRGQDGWGIWFGSTIDVLKDPDFFIINLYEAQHYIMMHWDTVETLRSEEKL
jgi:hypothetical protein